MRAGTPAARASASHASACARYSGRGGRQRVAPVGEGVQRPSREPAPARQARCRRAGARGSSGRRPPTPARQVQRPVQCRARLRRRSRSAGFSKKLPSAIASSMRTRSCFTTVPAPRFRCPTSELPIWPSGRPTARPQAVELRVRIGRPQLVEHGRVGQRDGVSRVRAARAPSRPAPRARRRAPRLTTAPRTRSPRTPRGSRLAPPTSAPSTSGRASSSAAFAAFTLPP